MILSQRELQMMAHYHPRTTSREGLMSAATALILRDGPQGDELLLMQRAQHEGDPWSGQMAFPGGKVELSDASQKAAAIRETAEEVSIELLEEDYIGQLDDVYGVKVNNQYSVHVSCFVFKPKRVLQPKGNHEVADLVWLPLSYLTNKENIQKIHHPLDKRMKLPAIRIDLQKDQILWGLSLRMLATLFNVIERPVTEISMESR